LGGQAAFRCDVDDEEHRAGVLGERGLLAGDGRERDLLQRRHRCILSAWWRVAPGTRHDAGAHAPLRYRSSSAARSPIAIELRLVGALGTVGITDASATCNPSTPRTCSRLSTTAPSSPSPPIRQ